MKKLLAMVMVLGLASVASASLTWSVDSLELQLGQSAVVMVSSNATSSGQAWAGPWNDAIAGITAVDVLVGAGDGASAVVNAGGWTGWATLEAKDTNPDNGGLVAGDWFAVTITGFAEGSTTFDSDSYGAFGANDSLSVTVVPEPITMTLLGLGGLVALRRRHA